MPLSLPPTSAIDERQAPPAARPGPLDPAWPGRLHAAFRARSLSTQQAVAQAVRTLAHHALAHTRTATPESDVYPAIEALIAGLDRQLTRQINPILHHPALARLEGAWRGLHHLVSHTETDTQLRIRVLNLGQREAQRLLRRYPGAAWDQSPLFRKIYEDEYGQLGGTPYGCLVADWYVDHGPADVELLAGVARIAAAAHAPFITGASPAVLQMQSWRELANPRDLAKIFENTEYAPWRSLRGSDDARFVGLAMPRFLARLPWGARGQPVEAFAFEEHIDPADPQAHVWANAAYAMAANITRAFKRHGWCTAIRGVESGGEVAHLPVHVFPSDEGGLAMQCPTEIAISDRREAELAQAGFMPLIHRKNSDVAAFIGANSLQRPARHDDPDATANAALAARLPALFAACRFAHYLKCLVRDKVGSFTTAAALQRQLTDWIHQYVIANPEHAGPALQARKPLAAAEVLVDEVPGQPGVCQARLLLRPHYQLEGMQLSLRLVSRLPRPPGA